MNHYRPVIKPVLQKADKILDLVAILLLACLWILSIYGYATLPDIIPIHFNFEGEPDNTGSKISILFLPLLATIIITGLSYLNKFPHVFNYPSTLSENNAAWHYLQATRMIRILKCSIAVVFIICIVMIIQGAYNKRLPYSGWEMPLIIGIVIVPVFFYLIKTSKKR